MQAYKNFSCPTQLSMKFSLLSSQFSAEVQLSLKKFSTFFFFFFCFSFYLVNQGAGGDENLIINFLRPYLSFWHVLTILIQASSHTDNNELCWTLTNPKQEPFSHHFLWHCSLGCKTTNNVLTAWNRNEKQQFITQCHLATLMNLVYGSRH